MSSLLCLAGCGTSDSQPNEGVNSCIGLLSPHFVALVQEKLREIGCEPKAVLLLDDL